MDTPEMTALRAGWKGYPNAQRPPFVLQGDSLASDYYWHGKILTQYANDWVRLFTKNEGNFVMTNMEDSGIAEALERLNAMHRADFQRLPVLRTASNCSMQRPAIRQLNRLRPRMPGTFRPSKGLPRRLRGCMSFS
jgi:purine nucleoside permease